MQASRKRRIALARSRRPKATIPTAGMADIAFLLLIFFMVIVSEPDHTRLDLPDSVIQDSVVEKAALVILLPGNSGGDVVFKFTDGVEQSRIVPDFAAIEAEAAALISREPGKIFKIKADGGISCGDIGRTFDALSHAGAARVLMVTRARDEERS